MPRITHARVRQHPLTGITMLAAWRPPNAYLREAYSHTGGGSVTLKTDGLAAFYDAIPSSGTVVVGSEETAYSAKTMDGANVNLTITALDADYALGYPLYVQTNGKIVAARSFDHGATYGPAAALRAAYSNDGGSTTLQIDGSNTLYDDILHTGLVRIGDECVDYTAYSGAGAQADLTIPVLQDDYPEDTPVALILLWDVVDDIPERGFGLDAGVEEHGRWIVMATTSAGAFVTRWSTDNGPTWAAAS